MATKAYARSVRRLVVATVPAFVVALAIVAMLPPNVLYPDRCSTYPTANGVPIHPGEFCIRYDPALGRYEVPPAGVPADSSRFATDTSRPDDVRLVAGAVAFGVALVVTWSLLTFTIRVRQSRPRRSHDIGQP